MEEEEAVYARLGVEALYMMSRWTPHQRRRKRRRSPPPT